MQQIEDNFTSFGFSCARRWLLLSDFLAIACWSAQHTLMLMKLHWNPELKKTQDDLSLEIPQKLGSLKDYLTRRTKNEVKVYANPYQVPKAWFFFSN